MLGIAALVAAAAWAVAPWCFPDPLAELETRTPVRIYRDRTGAIARMERTWGHQWRFDTPLSGISSNVVTILLATEDARFYRHHGVDYLASLRAAWQDLTSLRIVSGSSTITMQLAGLADENRRRTFAWKFKQAAQARRLEREYPKERILREYLDRIPMGGQIYGIEAASRYYFGRAPDDLNLSEAALLCGLPQSPARLRPDRHPERALRRMETVLRLAERQGAITSEEADRIRREDRLRFRDFSSPFPLRELEKGNFSTPYWEHLRRETAATGGPVPFDIRGTIDPVVQARAAAILRARRDALPGVNDGAAVVIDNATGDLLAYVGTLDFDSPNGGQVDSVVAVRSAGSALKPFLYGEAIDGGLLVADTLLLDAPMRYGDYMPANYDGAYRGPVKASEALSASLNTPAVRLLARLGEGRMMARMGELGLLAPAGTRWNGLALALGSAGHTLLGIARGYERIARGDAFHPSACAMVASMLRTPMPGTLADCAWKTGTSHDNHDAWCFAFTPDFTVGVWMGNKDGSGSPSLVGATAALPAAADLFDVLYAGRPPARWPAPSEYAEILPLCRKSGLRATPDCANTFPGHAAKGIPLAACPRCGRAMRPAGSFRILTPLPGTYRAGPDGTALIRLDAAAPATWFDNSTPLGHRDASWDHPLEPGPHSLLAVPDSGEDPSLVDITVVP